MSNSDDDPLIQNALEELAWLESQPPRPSFTHSFLKISLLNVVEALGDILKPDLPSYEEVFLGLTPITKRRVFLSDVNDDTILWHCQRDLPVSVELSRNFHATVHWISVHEDMTLRGYIQLVNGETEHIILDPEKGFRENILQGEDFIGKGKRQFASLDVFLDHISQWYRPVDTVWMDLLWSDEARRAETLQSGESSINRCIELVGTNNERHFRAIGEWEPAFVSHARALYEK